MPDADKPDTTKWRVQRAVRASELPAPSRLVMHTLIAIADAGTAEVPPQHTPSLSVLADETGLDRSTVARHLASLEAAKWLTRTREFGERTRYRLYVPAGFEPRQRGSRTTRPVAQDDHGPGRTVQQPPVAQDDSPSRTERHIEDQEDQNKTTTSSSPAAPPTADPEPEPPREDVEHVCTALADAIEANGSKRPTITATWRTAARLLLDRDGRTVDQVLTAIAWCQADEFWRSNILSMPKLREKYDQLRLAAIRETKRQQLTSPPKSRNQQFLTAARERILAAQGGTP